MKKFLIPIVSVIVGIIIPVAGMTITPTRDLILGLVPDEQILVLADKIDSERITTDSQLADKEQKIQELQSALTVQQTKIAEQEQAIASQASQIISTQQIATNAKNSAAKTALCSNLYLGNEYCSQKRYSNQTEFDKMVDDLEGTGDEGDIPQRTKYFNKCEEIRSQCD